MLVTYAYYVRTLKYYPPAIYHGQDWTWLDVAAGARTNIRCQKVKIPVPRRNYNALLAFYDTDHFCLRAARAGTTPSHPRHSVTTMITTQRLNMTQISPKSQREILTQISPEVIARLKTHETQIIPQISLVPRRRRYSDTVRCWISLTSSPHAPAVALEGVVVVVVVRGIALDQLVPHAHQRTTHTVLTCRDPPRRLHAQPRVDVDAHDRLWRRADQMAAQPRRRRRLRVY